MGVRVGVRVRRGVRVMGLGLMRKGECWGEGVCEGVYG